jgi:pimeloyl-ACP methyl ester carboxylesterase
VLPALLRALDVAAPVLIGHSDGASIALIHAASPGADLRGLVLMAPHVFVEDVTVAGIEAAREAWRTNDLRQRLAPHHDDVDGAFRGWNDIWLAPEFRAWNITGELPRVVAPALLIQGEDDQYGTPAQLAAIAAGVAGPTETVLLPGCRHSPHRDRPEETLAAIARFVAALR